VCSPRSVMSRHLTQHFHRPTYSQIDSLQRECFALKTFILALKNSSHEERQCLLSAAIGDDGKVSIPDLAQHGTHDEVTCERSAASNAANILERAAGNVDTPNASSDDEVGISHFISLDENGKPNSFGPSSALHVPSQSESAQSPPHHVYFRSPEAEIIQHRLIANAALARQMEHNIASLSSIDGTSTDIGLQLLDLHWTRQHHTFLLTYRPAIMRDLRTSGPYASPFLVNAIFACSSKYSSLPDIRDDPNDPSTAGRQFFRKCDGLLARDSLLTRPTLPTVVGLLLLGSTFNSRGETSKGWLYTGYALRMVYDLGLHLDPQQTTTDAEDIEIRRRVYWGAFVCDKLQSLYLGRPVALHLWDSQVSLDFHDLYEENERLQLRTNPDLTTSHGESSPNILLYSVSTFQQLCSLSKIMATIISRFYIVRTTFSNAQRSLEQVDQALQQWKNDLSSELDFQPWLSTPPKYPAPNVMLLHSLYYTLIILVHRPFISDGHLRSTSQPLQSWERCTVAARRITTIATAYRTAFGLFNGPYLLGYTVYVACTIHVRNAASDAQSSHDHASLLATGLKCLDELCVPNPGVARPARVIRKLIEVNNVNLISPSKAPFHSTTCLRCDMLLTGGRGQQMT